VKKLLSTTKGLTIALASVCATGTEAAPPTRYQCRLVDGSIRQLDQDISRRFPTLVKSCQPVEGGADSADEPKAAPVPSGDPSTTTVRVIVAQDEPASVVVPRGLQAIITSAGDRHGIDPRLIQAVIQVESAFNANARSPKGALGLMQLMPATAARFGAAADTDLFNPAVNVELGVRYLRVLSEQFESRIDLVLAAYNAGEGAVVRSGYEVPPYRETREYVRKILDLYPAGE